ncbi:hypothetical protein [uncultured Tateyamaria sp.]|uniref:hypothetical protein n=1 Tax=uncultured Tateyamaria sp. TaxID=455651 RepID=UPI00261D7AD8|nr:hypothetical protein [uncultured Tateyamaria sp.]
MPHRPASPRPLLVALCLLAATPTHAQDIELDWPAMELGFFQQAQDDGPPVAGLTVYVPTNRLATEADFQALVPAFCASNVKPLLEFAATIDDAPDVSLLKLQLDFYGPKVGGQDTYIARSAIIDLENGACAP